MSLQNYQWETAFYILPVTGCEALLGAAWLRTLGDIVWNFDKMTMRFGIGVQSYKAFCRMNAKLVSCKIMTKLLHQEREAQIPPLNPPTQNQFLLRYKSYSLSSLMCLHLLKHSLLRKLMITEFFWHQVLNQ